MPTVPNPCDSLEVYLSRVDVEVDIFQAPCVDVEISHPDMVIEIGTVANQGPKGDQGEKGDPGDPGGAGPPGSPGLAANVSVGSTVTGAPGSAASVTDSDPSGNAVLNFTIPRGDPGPVGPAGQGIAIKGTVPTSASLPMTGNSAGDVWIALDTNHGWSWNGTAWIDIGPLQGPAGTPGAPGTPATATAGTTTTSAPGSAANVVNAGTLSNAIFNFTIPRGADGTSGVDGQPGPPGTAASIATGPTVTGAPGTSANVINTGSSSAAVFAFTIPRGDVGASGSTGASGSPGNPGTPAWTLSTTSAFTVPPYGASVTINVADASWVALGEWVYIDDASGAGVAGQLVVTAKTATSLTLFNPTPTTYPLVTATAPGLAPSPNSVALRGFRTNSIGVPAWNPLDFINVVLFGADPTGTADSTTAIQNAINFASGGVVFFPAGTYKVSSAITLGAGTYLGAGPLSTIIQTTSATADVFSIGYHGVRITGFQFASSVARTAGSYITASSSYDDITIDNFLLQAPIIGINFNFVGVIQNGGINNIVATGAGIRVVSGIGLISAVIVNGGQTATGGIVVLASDGILISHCELFTCGTGIYLSAQGTNIIDSVIIDNTYIDTLNGSGIVLQSTAATAPVTHTAISQTWIASCNNYGLACSTSGGGIIDCVLVATSKILHSGSHGVIISDAGVSNLQIRDSIIWFNGTAAAGHGISLASGVSQFSIQGCKIGQTYPGLGPAGGPGNTGYGINFGGSNTNCIVTGNDLRGNTLGEQGGVPTGAFVLAENLSGAWIPYTATVVPGTGTITTQTNTSAYQQVGKTIFFRINVLLNNIGTATGTMTVNLPVATKAATTFCFRESGVNGFTHALTVGAGATSGVVNRYDATNPTYAANFSLNITGSYEAA